MGEIGQALGPNPPVFEESLCPVLLTWRRWVRESIRTVETGGGKSENDRPVPCILWFTGTASLLPNSQAFLRNTFRQLVARATPEGSHSPKTDAETPYPESQCLTLSDNRVSSPLWEAIKLDQDVQVVYMEGVGEREPF